MTISPISQPVVTHNFALDMLFNLGKAEGSVDAGQMIKPALARGLQLVGATTRRSHGVYGKSVNLFYFIS